MLHKLLDHLLICPAWRSTEIYDATVAIMKLFQYAQHGCIIKVSIYFKTMDVNF